MDSRLQARLKIGAAQQCASWAAGCLYYVSTATGPSVLLLKRSEHVDHSGTWACPGGFGDEHETPFETAVREAFEETAFSGGRYGDVCVQQGLDVRKYYIFLMEVDDPFEPRLNHENSDWAWYPLGVLETVDLHPGFASGLDAVKGRILYLLQET